MTAEIGVVFRLHPGLSDDVSQRVALTALRIELGLVDLTDVSEEVGAERLVPVAPQEAVSQLHTRELELMFLEIGDLVGVHTPHKDHRGQRILRVGLDLRENLLQGQVRDRRERLKFRLLGRPGLRQVGGPHLKARTRNVRHEHMPVSVEHHAARCVDLNRPHAVLRGLGEVLVAREHLQRPQPQNEHREDAQCGEANDCHPERRLRCQTIRLFDARVARHEATET